MKYLPYIHTRMGTESSPRYSRGNTLPLTQYPFGMAPFALQTEKVGGARGQWFFAPREPGTEGIRLTHMPSPWIGEWGSVLLTPQSDIIADEVARAWSGYHPEEAVMAPDYLAVRFLRAGCLFELTPTERCAALRLTFDTDLPAALSFFPTVGRYSYRFDEETSTLYGVTDGVHWRGNAKDFRMYIVAQFSKGCVCPEHTRAGGEGEGAFFHVGLRGRCAEVRIGISYISEQMAEEAIRRECGGCSFDTLRAECAAAWEEKLSRIAIEPTSPEQMRIFYSCLYRVFLYPQKAYEITPAGEKVHYCPADGGVHPGVRYTGNGFWDTYRTVYPLFSLIAREEFAEMLEAYVGEYRESGWLPRWIALGEVGCMPSTLIDGVIAEAVSEGIGSPALWEEALAGMLKHANCAAPEKYYGREGVLSYLRYGYVPREEKEQSVNLTLDAAYGDWCIATVARALGREELAREYFARSRNYRNLFDPETGFMRGKDREGHFAPNFDPCRWGGEYTEAAAWQTSLFVPHDIEGLAQLYGGREKLLAHLDELFRTPPRYRVGGYGREIHEMTEMASANFGQCAISNQPSFHIPFLFAALGEPQKSAMWVRRLAEEGYTVERFPGDEDNGTAAAWYILACLGLYRLCPGSGVYVRTPMLVKSAKVLGKEWR